MLAQAYVYQQQFLHQHAPQEPAAVPALADIP